MPSPIDETIIFPNGLDDFPTVYDGGTADVSTSLTKVWAEYSNKIRNLIGVLQPCLQLKTAGGDGTLTGLTTVSILTQISFEDARNYRASALKAKTDWNFKAKYGIEETIRGIINIRNEGRIKDFSNVKYSNLVALQLKDSQ